MIRLRIGSGHSSKWQLVDGLVLNARHDESQDLGDSRHRLTKKEGKIMGLREEKVIEEGSRAACLRDIEPWGTWICCVGLDVGRAGLLVDG